jgi:hypothetical protein
MVVNPNKLGYSPHNYGYLMLYIRLLQKLHFQEWWVFESSHVGFPVDSCGDLQFRSGLISTISSSNWFTVHSEVVQIASPLKFTQQGRFHRANGYRFGFLTVSEMWTSGLKLVPLEKRIFEHRKQIPSSKPTWRGNGKILSSLPCILFIHKESN